MLVENNTFPSDYYSLLFSYFEFIFSTITFMNGADSMMVNVLVVVGFNMVGTKSWERLHLRLSKKLQSFKDCRFGCDSRSTTTEQVLADLFFFMPF